MQLVTPALPAMFRTTSKFLLLFLLWVSPLAAEHQPYESRQDTPWIDCKPAKMRTACTVHNIYPSKPNWKVSVGQDIVAETTRDVVYFDHPYRTWAEVHMDVVRIDGELVVISLAVIRNGGAYYCLPLEDTHGFNMPKCKVPPQWAYDLPDYDKYFAGRARSLP